MKLDFMLVARVAVIGLLIFFINATFSLRTENKQLKQDIKTLTVQFDQYKKDVTVKINGMNSLYEERRLDQIKLQDQLRLLEDQAAKEHVIVSKPGLSAIKINKSFSDFVKSMNEVSK